ncbi:MAG TPA: hypothetical protein VF782_00215 [Allosphingosinicella sp.]|jgi:O-antigen/teichoic acid export membrane protein
MARRIGGYAMARIVAGLLLYLTLVSLVYALDKKDYEQFSTAYAASQVIGTLIFGWIYAIIPQRVAGLGFDDQIRRQTELTGAFAWMCLVAVAALCAAYLFGALDISFALLAAVAAMVIAGSASEQAVTLANAKERPRIYLLASAARSAAGLVLALLLGVALDFGAPGVLLGLAIASLLTVGLASKPLHLAAGGLQPIRLGQLGALLATGIPAIIAFAVYPLAMSINRLVVAQTCSLEAAAALGAVNDMVAGPAMLVFAAINLAIMPAVYGAANRNDHRDFARRVMGAIGLQIALIVAGAIFFLLFGGLIGGVLRASSLSPLAADMVPYVGMAVLFFVLINTAAGIALARRRIGIAALFGFLVVAGSVALVLGEDCDLIGISKAFAMLMAGAAIVSLLFVVGLTRLPPGADDTPPPEAGLPLSAP